MRKRLFLVFFALAAAAVLGFAYRTIYYPAEWWHEYLPAGAGEPVPVLVRQGMNARKAADEFESAGVLERGTASDLARWMTRFSIDRRLKPGMYHIRRGSPWEVARQLEKAEPAVSSATIVPGTDIFSFPGIFTPPLAGETMEKILARNDLFPKEIAALLPAEQEGRIAFLLPETVQTAEKSGEEVVSSAARLWWDRIGSRIPEEKRTAEYFLEMAVISSLIEREALWDEERALIAGVIENRRKKKMPLQIDATVVYAWKKEGRNLTRVLYKDLEIDSPYNTYKIPELPPAPICIPSEKSWLAALCPEKTKYLYYVAGQDGKHLFSETLSGHQRNIRKVRGK